jgi:hypothetical protein
VIDVGDVLLFAPKLGGSSTGRRIMVVLLVAKHEPGDNFNEECFDCLMLDDSFAGTDHEFTGVVAWPTSYLADPDSWRKL